jgi:MFS family permease
MNAKISLNHDQSSVAFRLIKINAVSFLSQVVQIGTVPAILALRLNDSHYSLMTVGIVAAAPWIAILLVGSWVPALIKHFGFTSSNWIALTITALSLIGSILSNEAILLFVANFLLGVGLIIRWVSCDTWIVAAAPESIRGRAIGTHETLMGCGIAAGPLVIAFTGVDSALPLLGCLALVGVSALILFSLQNCNGYPSTPGLTQRKTIARMFPTALVAGFLAGFIETSSISFMPVLGDRELLSLSATMVLAGFGIGGTVLQIPLGWLADKAGFRTTQLITATVIFLGAILLPLVRHHDAPLLVLIFLWGGAAGGMNTLAVVEAGSRVDSASVSTAMMTIALAYTIGSIIGPMLTGWAVDSLPTIGFSVVSASAAAIFLLTWVAFRKDVNACNTSAAPIDAHQ